MKYIYKQPHRKACGPVAIVNILRSFGLNISYKQILHECGGLQKISKKGTSTRTFKRVMKKHNIDCQGVHISLNDIKVLIKHPKLRLALAYVWKAKHPKIKNRTVGCPHIVMIDPITNKGINTNKYCRVNNKRWKDTKAHWGFPPITYVCMVKPGGVK